MKVVILDTGCANLSSVKYAIDRLGVKSIISYDKSEILMADKILLPGVGTAKAAMKNLKDRDLIQLICDSKQPVLGICLGMQLLASNSEEGNVATLDLIDAKVSAIPPHHLPLPHMGWNTVNYQTDHPLFRGIPENAYFYFVHSYAIPLCKATIATTNYGEHFSAAIQKNNFYGVQFHPERSGLAGAKLLQNFLEM